MHLGPPDAYIHLMLFTVRSVTGHSTLRYRFQTIPVGPLAGALPGQIRNLAEALLANAQPEFLAAIRSGSQARVNQLKAQLSGQIANRLTNQLNRSFSFYDGWFTQ